MTSAIMTRRIKLLQYVKPFLPFLPDIAPPTRRVVFREKLTWTIFSLIVFLVCSQIPLYGIGLGNKNDPFYWIRVILASNRGTLMELGISPIVTTSMVLQFLAGSRVIEVDQGIKEDRVLFQATQKFCGLAFTVIQAAMYVGSGMYGEPSTLGGPVCFFIVFQLTFAGGLVIMIDELLQKGYGLGSGISLFISTNICQTICWKALSPATINTPNGPVFEGAVTSFWHQLLFSSNRLSAITEAFYRPYGANLTNLVATAFVFCTVVYFQGFRIDLAVKSQKVRGQTGTYPIRLFYTSNMPIILHSALISNVYFFSQLIYKRFKSNMLVNLLGQWQEVEFSGEAIPVGGFAYYLSPPMSILDFLLDPIRSIIYCAIVIGSCSFLSKAWIDIAGEAPRDVAKKLKDQQLTIVGYRETTLVNVLTKYIPHCAQLGGAIIAVLTIVADLLGCVGSGTGMLLAVTITYSYFEQAARETNGNFLGAL